MSYLSERKITDYFHLILISNSRYGIAVVFAENSCCFVKIISLKNGNFDLALRKRLFCDAKPTLLPCKRAAFGMQNNRFCNALIDRWLCKSGGEKYLQSYNLLFVLKVGFFIKFLWNPTEFYQECRKDSVLLVNVLILLLWC